MPVEIPRSFIARSTKRSFGSLSAIALKALCQSSREAPGLTSIILAMLSFAFCASGESPSFSSVPNTVVLILLANCVRKSPPHKRLKLFTKLSKPLAALSASKVLLIKLDTELPISLIAVALAIKL